MCLSTLSVSVGSVYLYVSLSFRLCIDQFIDLPLSLFISQSISLSDCFIHLLNVLNYMCVPIKRKLQNIIQNGGGSILHLYNSTVEPCYKEVGFNYTRFIIKGILLVPVLYIYLGFFFPWYIQETWYNKVIFDWSRGSRYNEVDLYQSLWVNVVCVWVCNHRQPRTYSKTWHSDRGFNIAMRTVSGYVQTVCKLPTLAYRGMLT